ncbi:MAG: DUF2027 domain-containing protein [Muribaculaceae bacterium]|nr:DUF2027 domain-containing protein [Muribaculaceae bacterium]MDE6487394.1 DUF2027 domain-containing protein [Muribaculaceae bacterium]
MTPKTGDTVRYLNSVGGGRIVKISGNMAYVDEDGFETPVLLRECVVVAAAGTPEPAKGIFKEPARPAATTPAPAAAPTVKAEQPAPIEETEGGDTLNIVLGFEPTDIKNLSQSTFDSFLVNDSNYWIDFAVLTRADSDTQWTLRHRGTAEPNMQVFAGEFSRSDLPAMDRLAVQLCAYKTDRPFDLKQPALVEFNLDTTRFARLHCFTRNEYFDTPVIALDIVRGDRPSRPLRIDPAQLERAMAEKRRTDSTPRRKPAPKPAGKNGPIEVDLHANAIFDDMRGLSNADILNAQVDRFREVMDAHLRHAGTRIVFIHGKGNGVLREALMKELNHRYKGHDVQDASFREYGFGATQVTIRPNAARR